MTTIGFFPWVLVVWSNQHLCFYSPNDGRTTSCHDKVTMLMVTSPCWMAGSHPGKISMFHGSISVFDR